MPSHLHSVTVDCHDPFALATWWAQALGGVLGSDDAPGDPAAVVQVPGLGAPLLFLAVPDVKSVKNRWHLDLEPDEGGSRESEVERLVALGAVVGGDLRNPDGTGWVVLTDPEGNEFCVLRSAAQRAATGG